MNSKVFYKFMAGMYDLLEVIYFRQPETSPRKTVLDSIGSDDSILDLCTGTATNALRISQARPKAKIVGIDISKDMLRMAYKKCKKDQKFIDKRIAFDTIISKESPADKWTFKKRQGRYGDTTVKDYGNIVLEMF